MIALAIYAFSGGIKLHRRTIVFLHSVYSDRNSPFIITMNL